MPYAEVWARLLDGIAQTAERLAEHGRLLFLEHKNSEPAMKILMRNMGMTLHVIHKLRERGIDNVKVNMDWQHLIMNGEHLPEYAALLAAEGLLGHQHANSGWGTFDDDNMVGATAFMETLELALELRRAGYGANGERLGFDLYPYTEDQVAAVKRSVLQWRFIDGVAARIDEPALREAQSRKDAVRAYELVYAALGASSAETRARRRSSGSTSARTGVKASRSRRRRRGARAAPSTRTRSRRRSPGWAEQDPERLVARRRRRRSRELAGAGRIGLSGQMHGLVALDADERVLRPAILWNDQRTGGRVRRDRGARRARAADRADRQPRADRASRRRSSSGCAGTSPTSTRGSAHVLLPKDYVRLRLTGEHAIDVADASGTLLFDVARAALERRGAGGARAPARRGCRRRSSRRRGRAAPATRRRARSASASTGPGPLSVVLGTSGVVFARAARATRADAEARVHAFCHAVPGDVARDGRDALGRRLARVAAGVRSARRTTSCSPEAASVGARARGAALPAVPRRASGRRTPTPTRAARSSGSQLRHDRGALVRAVLEGVAYGLRDSLELLRELGVRPEVGRVSGGGARSRLWLEIVASVLGLPLERTAVEEGAAYGAALLAGVARRRLRGRARGGRARASASRERIEPNAAWAAAYADGYERFRALYPALRPL